MAGFVRCIAIAFLCLARGVAAQSWAAEPAPGKEPSAEKRGDQASKCPRIALAISRETTYITEPLRKDGYVDYIAAINDRCRQGVTPENNAAVLFSKAMGPGAIPKPHREQFFKLLGIPPIPEEAAYGDYFLDIDRYSTAFEPRDEFSSELWGQWREAAKRPWSKDEFPALAAWLVANEKPLSLFFEATKRSRRYDPLVCDDCPLDRDSSYGPDQHAATRACQYREACRGLLVRATLRLGERKTHEAWRDLLACHRAARLVGQGATLIEAIVAHSIRTGHVRRGQGRAAIRPPGHLRRRGNARRSPSSSTVVQPR